MRRNAILTILFSLTVALQAQINTDKVMSIARNALYFEDYVLSIQYFNQVIRVKPHMAEPYFFRAVAKLSLEDYQGADEDCTLALERNPYIVDAYLCRGIARQNMLRYQDAISDYERGLKHAPEHKSFLANSAICYTQEKNYDKAEEMYTQLIRFYPSFSNAYLARGGMYLERADTLKALSDMDKALNLDKYNSRAYAMRGIIHIQQTEYKKALDDMNQAVKLEPSYPGYILNRALARYYLNDLRGTMQDYDRVLTLEPHNLTARYNRGLLRMQVGDNNRAIQDFTEVLKLEPENYFAYYNRAILHNEVGQSFDAIDDLTKVLTQYPRFTPAYYMRADIKRKMNDAVGADKDYWTALNIEKEHRDNVAATQKQTAGAPLPNDAIAAADTTSTDNNKTRKSDDKNINKFNRLLLAEKENTDNKTTYQNNDIRGRVQDRSVSIDLEPMFLYTYYERSDKVNSAVLYQADMQDYNKRGVLGRLLKLTNAQAALTEDQIAHHFESINEHSSTLGGGSINTTAYFARSIDFLLTQDYPAAIEDLNKVIEYEPTNTLALLNRAVIRYKQLEYERSSDKQQDRTHMPSSTFSFTSAFGGGKSRTVTSTQIDPRLNKRAESRADYDLVMRDLDRVINQLPENFTAYYNRANLRCALSDYRTAVIDYTTAIRKEPDFAEAYYNRGIVYIYLGQTQLGIADLSKAGELGIVSAYSLIKRLAD